MSYRKLFPLKVVQNIELFSKREKSTTIVICNYESAPPSPVKDFLGRHCFKQHQHVITHLHFGMHIFRFKDLRVCEIEVKSCHGINKTFRTSLYITSWCDGRGEKKRDIKEYI